MRASGGKCAVWPSGWPNGGQDSLDLVKLVQALPVVGAMRRFDRACRNQYHFGLD
jgi:hypothetical protein